MRSSDGHPPSPITLDTHILMIPKPTGLCQSFTGAQHSRHLLSYMYQRHFRLNKLQTDLFTFQSSLCLTLPPSRLLHLPGSSGREPGLTLQSPSVTPNPSPSPVDPTANSHPCCLIHLSGHHLSYNHHLPALTWISAKVTDLPSSIPPFSNPFSPQLPV